MESGNTEPQDTKASEEISQLNGLKRIANGSNHINGLRETNGDELLKRIQEMKEDILEHVNNRIGKMMVEIQKEIVVNPEINKQMSEALNQFCEKRQSNRDDTLTEKVFKERNSPLTDLFKVSHIKAVYNIFSVTLLVLLFNTIAQDLIETGTLSVGTTTIQTAFAKLPTALFIWSFMFMSTIYVYLAFNIWAHQRLKFTPKSVSLKIWDYSWLSGFILYQILFLYFPTKTMFDEELTLACRLAVLMEQVRMMMKTYAFVRSVASRFLSYKPHTEVPRPSGPDFSHYLYFLFVPTVVYRDNYPRTKKIRWRIVVWNFAEVSFVIFYYALIWEYFMIPVFQVFGKQSLDWRWYVKSVLATVMPGSLFFITSFYLLLHAWLNAWAEMLRFADRLFYKDWWNCTSYRRWYRTWNVVVQDWLYMYVYKDMLEIVSPHNKQLATFAVFFISSVFHEYILAFACGFFYPVVLVMFGGIGYAMIFAGRAGSNLLLLLSLCVGNGIIFSLYTIEYYARQNNCQPHYKYLDLFLPRSWFCSI